MQMVGWSMHSHHQHHHQHHHHNNHLLGGRRKRERRKKLGNLGRVGHLCMSGLNTGGRLRIPDGGGGGDSGGGGGGDGGGGGGGSGGVRGSHNNKRRTASIAPLHNSNTSPITRQWQKEPHSPRKKKELNKNPERRKQSWLGWMPVLFSVTSTLSWMKPR